MQNRISDIKISDIEVFKNIYKNNKIEGCLYFLELATKSVKDLPHYKYVARPFYKAMGGNTCVLFSVPSTFLVMDFLFHQLPTNLVQYATDENASCSILLHLDMVTSAIWATTGVSLSLYKQFRTIDPDKIRSDLGEKAMIEKAIIVERYMAALAVDDDHSYRDPRDILRNLEKMPDLELATQKM